MDKPFSIGDRFKLLVDTVHGRFTKGQTGVIQEYKGFLEHYGHIVFYVSIDGVLGDHWSVGLPEIRHLTKLDKALK